MTYTKEAKSELILSCFGSPFLYGTRRVTLTRTQKLIQEDVDYLR